MSKLPKGSKKSHRKSLSGRSGGRRQADEFQDAILRAKIRTIHEELGGRADAAQIYSACQQRHVFTENHLIRFGRRAAIEYIRGALGENNPNTGFPYAHAVPGKDGPNWIQELLMTPEEYAEMLRGRAKQLSGDYGEYRRLYDRGVQRYGEEKMPPMVQMELVEGGGAHDR